MPWWARHLTRQQTLSTHAAVRHSVGEYVRGEVHTNGMESFWSMLKRGYYGTYHKMSFKHLRRYVAEFAARHNIRDLDTLEQMAALAKGIEGKRLMYRHLIAGPQVCGPAPGTLIRTSPNARRVVVVPNPPRRYT